MTIKSRLSSWLRYGKSDELIDGSLPERREFVYLDEISVLSILSSRKGGIATEFTEKQTAIMQVGHLGSCLTRKLTGRYAFDVICRLVFEMATRYRRPR